MALPATLVWEIRPANGATDGGGSFDPSVASAGTDFSIQNGVQVAFTDLVVGTPNTTVTSVGNPFDSTHVGNTIAITTTGGGAAWTTGFYNIRSVAAAVATLDRSPAATGSTAGVGNLGGARRGYNDNGGAPVTTLQSALVAGNIVYVKNEAWNEAVALTVAGYIQHIGYNATRNDITVGSGNLNNPTNDRATAAGDAFSLAGASNWVYNINQTRAGDAGFTGAGFSTFVNCRTYNNAGEGWENSGAVSVFACEADLNGSNGQNGNGLSGAGSFLHDNSGSASQFNTARFSYNIVVGNSTAGIIVSVATGIVNNTVVGNGGTAGDGIILNFTAVGSTFLSNNICAFNGRYGVGAGANSVPQGGFNDYYGNGTAATSNILKSVGDLTLDPQFTGPTSTTFATTDVDTANDTIAVTISGLVVNDVVFFTNSGGGLPAGLSAGTAYFIITATNPIKVSTTRGGSSVNITTQGTGTHTIITSGLGNYAIGTNLKAAGFPGVFPAGLSTGYLDIGAVQRQETGGGSAGMLYRPNMAGT